MIAKKYSDLFAYSNYRFSTEEKGRQSSLYFEDAQGNQGRWRRQHPDGELLIWQGQSRRIYMHRKGMPFHADNKMLKIYRDIQFVLRSDQNYSAVPRKHWHVIEMCPPSFYVRHRSSGRILLEDPTAGAADYAGIANYDGALVDWTLP